MESGKKIFGKETPTEKFGSGAMVIGKVVVIGYEVVIRDDGRVWIWKKSETGIEDVGVDTFIIEVEVGGTKVAAMSSTSYWIESSHRKSETVWDSESSWATRDGDLGFQACFFEFFFWVLTIS